MRQAQLAVLNDPGLVTKRRAELARERGIGETAVKLPEGGRVAAPNPKDCAAILHSGRRSSSVAMGAERLG